MASSSRASFSGLAGPSVNLRSLGLKHASLTKTVWLRILLERELQKKTFELKRDKHGSYVFIVSPGFSRDTVPWAPFPSDDYRSFSLWSLENKKMACPSFSLPAGGLLTCATCPGADAGQTVTPVAQRQARLEAQSDGWHTPNNAPGTGEKPLMREGLTICSQCYATGGNFAYANIQTAEVIRYWWLRQNLAAGRMDWLVQIFVDGIRCLPFKPDRHGIRPIRLHDSGDFFSEDYAEMWCRIADELATSMPNVIIWAPTRTWAAGNWPAFWERRLPTLKSLASGRPNLVVRPSGYNFGDWAPGPLHPTNAKGSTSLYDINARVPDFLKSRVDPAAVPLPGPAEPRSDFNCQVYGAEEPSCLASRAPDGKVGCRACWVHPELSINYSSH